MADTIAAIATAPGAGGIGVVRVSGPDAPAVLHAVFRPTGVNAPLPRVMRHGRVVDAEGRDIDEVLAVFFPGPRSFTGEDVVEIHGHGGTAVTAAVLDAVLAQGARPAERGEFTRRAFVNGRMDLTQAEAVAEIIAAPSLEGVRLASAKLEGLLGRRIAALRERLEYVRQRLCLAVDFPEEEGECLPPAEFLALVDEVAGETRALLAGYQRARCWREGALVVLAGRVNVGKSSLMNALLGRPRAIVTEKAGTTRDYLEEQTQLAGLPVRLVDTAGLRETENAGDDPIEQEGMRRGRELAQAAQAVLIVVDGAALGDSGGDIDEKLALERELAASLGPARCLVVWNKADRAPLPARPLLEGVPALEVCALTGQGLDKLAEAVRALCGAAEPAPEEIAPNARQAAALQKALDELALLAKDIRRSVPPDVCGLRLDAAAAHLADITGLNSAEETLNAIFAEFCIGK